MRKSVLGVPATAAITALLFWGPCGWSQPPAAQAPGDGPPPGMFPGGGPPGGGPFGGPGGGGPGGFRFPAPPLVDALDANHDGEVDAAEIAAAAEHLKALDKNTDGQLSEDELMPAFPGFGRGPGGPGGPGGGGPGGRGFGGRGAPGGGPGGPGGGPPGPGGPGGNRTVELLARFDADKDGMLNQAERAKARAFLKENPAAGGGPFARGPGGPGGRGPGGRDQGAAPKPGKRLSPDEVAKYPDARLYDPGVLRTLFFEFDGKDWEEELEDFHNTDVEVPAKLIVDGKTYEKVGMGFRGMSSYGMVPRGKKRSLNVTVDLVKKDQRLLGYRSLNLLNSNADPSFLRTVMFDHVARQYVPAPQANLVRVVVNGECWGIFINEQPFNKDFAEHWFGESKGVRWKVPANFSGAGALVYHGDDVEQYRRLYELKSNDKKRAWKDLVSLCKQLEQLPDEKLETELDRVLNVDRALWFLALDAVFIDDDGYISRGSDYSIYQDAQYGRFHLLPRDSNETFRYHGGGPGGPGGFQGPGGPGGPRGQRGPDAAGSERGRGETAGMLDPVNLGQASSRPLVRRVLANPHLRARYIAHLRTIVKESLDWKVLGPVFEDYRLLIAEDVLADTRNLSNFAEFFDADIAESTGGGPFGGAPGMKRFIEDRRKYLRSHVELVKPMAAIISVEVASPPQAGSPIQVVAQVGQEVPVEAVILYYAVGRNAPFKRIEMKPDASRGEKQIAGVYSASIPAVNAGDDVYYYVEARAEKSVGTTTFSPARAEAGALHFRVAAAGAAEKDAKKGAAKRGKE